MGADPVSYMLLMFSMMAAPVEHKLAKTGSTGGNMQEPAIKPVGIGRD